MQMHLSSWMYMANVAYAVRILSQHVLSSSLGNMATKFLESLPHNSKVSGFNPLTAAGPDNVFLS